MKRDIAIHLRSNKSVLEHYKEIVEYQTKLLEELKSDKPLRQSYMNSELNDKHQEDRNIKTEPIEWHHFHHGHESTYPTRSGRFLILFGNDQGDIIMTADKWDAVEKWWTSISDEFVTEWADFPKVLRS